MVVSPDKFKSQILLKTFSNLIFQMMKPSLARLILRKLTRRQPSANPMKRVKLTFVPASMTTCPNNGSSWTLVLRCPAALHNLGMSLTLGWPWRQWTDPSCPATGRKNFHSERVAKPTTKLFTSLIQAKQSLEWTSSKLTK